MNFKSLRDWESPFITSKERSFFLHLLIQMSFFFRKLNSGNFRKFQVIFRGVKNRKNWSIYSSFILF
ncbi:hypothetical protein E4414_16105 [Leptospira interrogans]|nr:hypothetical protein E4414_16105 [Leptospira interrogans]